MTEGSNAAAMRAAIRTPDSPHARESGLHGY